MIARTDLSRANALVEQYNEVQRGLVIIDQNPRISGMTIVAVDPEQGGSGEDITIDAAGISYPPQMIQAIKTQLEERLARLNEQLTELGVSPSSPAPAKQKAKT
jgi:hypothetical protein